jgi:predicted enzyme related to lactoylglutathione lyase
MDAPIGDAKTAINLRFFLLTRTFVDSTSSNVAVFCGIFTQNQTADFDTISFSQPKFIMQTDQKIDYLELPAKDLKVVQAFYEKAFDWTFTSYGDEYIAFNDGSIDGGFYKSNLSSTTEHGAALIVFYAIDLEATREKVKSSGGTVIKEIFSFPGGRRFQFLDPNGNELGVWSDK